MFGLGIWEVVGIAALVLLLFGPRQLPKLGHSLGATIGALRRAFAKDAADGSLRTQQDLAAREPSEEKSAASGQ